MRELVILIMILGVIVFYGLTSKLFSMGLYVGAGMEVFLAVMWCLLSRWSYNRSNQ